MIQAIKDFLVKLIPTGPILALLKPTLIGLIQAHGDELQAKLKEAIAKEGPEAVDKTIDSVQAALISKINAL